MDVTTTIEEIAETLLDIAFGEYDDNALALFAADLLPSTPNGAAKIRCLAVHLDRLDWWLKVTPAQLRIATGCRLTNAEWGQYASERAEVWADEASDAAHRAVMVDRGYIS